MNSTLKNGIIASIMVLVVVCLGTVAAQDVIVKQGTIGTGTVSPDPNAKVFISENASDVYREDCYGLLTVTTDSTNGTSNRYGAICEFFPAAGDTSSLYPKTGGGFFCDVVGTEVKDRMYYGLYGGTAGKKDAYIIDNNNVSLYGIAFDVENENDVVGGNGGSRTYKTCAVSALSKPVNTGYEMTGRLTFKNYGIDVCAQLDGNYQADTLGHGENYGVRIVTSEQLANAATKPIYSYALWLQAFASAAKLGTGGATWGLYQYGANVNNRFEGNLEVQGVFDNTPGYSGTVQDALNEILNTKSINGKIDHSSLPVMARATLKRVEKTNVRMVEQTDPSGKIVQVEEYDMAVVEEEGRNLGAMVTVLTEAVKGLNEKLEGLAAENQILKAEIAALKAAATTP